MRSMFSAKFAVFFQTELVRGFGFVLCAPVILSFAIGTIQTNNNSHILLQNLGDNACANGSSTLTDSES